MEEKGFLDINKIEMKGLFLMSHIKMKFLAHNYSQYLTDKNLFLLLLLMS